MQLEQPADRGPLVLGWAPSLGDTPTPTSASSVVSADESGCVSICRTRPTGTRSRPAGQEGAHWASRQPCGSPIDRPGLASWTDPTVSMCDQWGQTPRSGPEPHAQGQSPMLRVRAPRSRPEPHAQGQSSTLRLRPPRSGSDPGSEPMLRVRASHSGTTFRARAPRSGSEPHAQGSCFLEGHT